MATNFRGEGMILAYTPATAVTSGQVVAIGNVIGVAVTAIAASEVGAVAIEGVHLLAKTTGVINQGQGLWWDAANSRVSETPTGQWAGICTVAAGSSDTTVAVKLNVRTNTGEKATLTFTDSDNAASTGVALRIIEQTNNSFNLLCENANNADAYWASTLGSLLVDDVGAGTGVALYYDEDGAQGARLLAALPGGKDGLLVDSFGNKWIIKYSASPSSSGVACYFDDDGATVGARVLFVSPTNTTSTYDADFGH